MKYIQDAYKLGEVTKLLASHIDDAKGYYVAQLDLQLVKNDELDGLANLFAIANREKRGFSTKGLIASLSSFLEGIEDIIEKCDKKEPEQAHSEFLKWLCSLEGTNQKTANLYLKWLVMFDNTFEFGLLDWSAWEKYLHVPLDRWVLRLIGEQCLNVGTSEYNHDFARDNVPTLSYEPTSRYFRLQAELQEVTSRVNQPRIVLDELWLIGRIFCTYLPVLCDHCWINKYCVEYHKVPDK